MVSSPPSQYCLVGDADLAMEAVVDAEMNAEVVVMAEEYYRKVRV